VPKAIKYLFAVGAVQFSIKFFERDGDDVVVVRAREL
jgi:hypothetical protein